MLAVAQAESCAAHSARVHDCGGASPSRSLARGEVLFHTGDKRGKLYRIESGALCHYLRWEDGRREIIEFAFPGDIVGFGHLQSHV